MTKTIVVLGATGNVGSAVVTHLGATGIVPRVLTRRPEATWDVPVERVVGDFANPGVLAQLFAGAGAAFVVSTIESDPAIDQTVADSAARAGVPHVVKLSTIGVESELGIGARHREREQQLERSGMSWTFLRPGFFMTNVLRWRDDIHNTGVIHAPAADGPTAPISPRDIAEVAMLALRDPARHAGKAYALTGAQLLSTREQIDIIARVLRRPLTCVNVPPGVAAANAREGGMPGWLASTLEALWSSIEAGKAAFTTTTFTELTGRPPETFETWVTATAAALLPPDRVHLGRRRPRRTGQRASKARARRRALAGMVARRWKIRTR
jgi:uncharacterized protein YbjT (DUF2867 family)